VLARLFSIMAVAFLACSAAGAAGLKRLEIPAVDGGQALFGAVWFPCALPNGRVRLGRILVPGVKDCPVLGAKLPLVVISHGYSGWFGGHRDTAATLADAGYVVAAITHRSEYDRRWRYERPAAIKRLIDYMLRAWPDRTRIDRRRIGFFGFSRGGYTGLVAIGGVPDFRRITRHCRLVPSARFCRPSRGSKRPGTRKFTATKRPYIHDTRIKAAVIAAPLGVVFGREGLKSVSVPVQLWRTVRDERVKFPYHAEAVSKALPIKPDYRVVQAGHFAFLAPCAPRQTRAVPAVCRDADGFDRAAFHQRFNAEILRFFEKHLR